MKKTLCLLYAVIFTLLLSPVCYAAEKNTDTLAMWNITVVVPNNAASAVLKGSSYYIYAKKEGKIPYVMLNVYKYDSEETFIRDFTEYMRKQYSDLKVSSEATQTTIGDKDCYEIDYSYTISGYQARDRRIVITVNGLTYMFASKEIPSRGDTVGNMLEQVVADCIFLDEDGNPLTELEDEEPVSANAFLYRTMDGMPKYWLDFSGGMVDNLVLHCYFRSSDPTFYEKCFILHLEDADIAEEYIRIHTVTDMRGNDVSNWFRGLLITMQSKSIAMVVRRDERSLAGGSEDNILSGVYEMEPISVGIAYEYSLKDGQLKYWIDRDDSGDGVLLHAMLRSGDPEYREEVFRLVTDEGMSNGMYTIKVKKVFTQSGLDVSNKFKSLQFTEAQSAFLMNVQRNEVTVVAAPDGEILTGSYLLEPRTYPLPREEGPYSAAELAQWAQTYYFTHNGFYPPKADVVKNKDGSFTIHLYEVVKLDGVEHTATSAWYTVDAYGAGTNTITEQPVNLFK